MQESLSPLPVYPLTPRALGQQQGEIVLAKEACLNSYMEYWGQYELVARSIRARHFSMDGLRVFKRR